MRKPVKTLNVRQVADLLGVSLATVRNWSRSGVLQPLLGHKTVQFDEHEINQIKHRLQMGTLNKLNRRAHKTQSHQKHSHCELLLNRSQQAQIEDLYKKMNISKKDFLFSIYAAQLITVGLAAMKSSRLVCKKRKIQNELRAWGVSDHQLSDKISMIRDSQLNLQQTILSAASQWLSEVGEKNKAGSYYTPFSMIEPLIKSTVTQPGSVCDPCCGSGHFLMSAYTHLKAIGDTRAAQNIFGFDCDELAVLLTRAQLTLISHATMDVVKQIRLVDFLKMKAKPSFRYILTNPPWGAHFDKKTIGIIKKNFTEVQSAESASFFLVQGLRSLKPNGRLVFILPVSFMNVRQHRDIRKFVSENYQTEALYQIKQKFSGVFTQAFAWQIAVKKPDQDFKVSVFAERQFTFKNSEIQAPDFAFSFDQCLSTRTILKKIETKGTERLSADSKWGLGIVTGDNARFLSAHPQNQMSPVLKGRDIQKYKTESPQLFLNPHEEQLQQVAPLTIYFSDAKLIYRFISRNLVFAIDRKKQLTLNSANVLIPVVPGYSIEAVCAVLNSNLAQFYFIKKFNSIKVLRSHLESFPFAKLKPQQVEKLNQAVQTLEKSSDQIALDTINRIVEEAYGVSESDLDLR